MTAVDLAHEPPFALGQVSVTPAALMLEAGEWLQRLEPRAMQVLVVLAHASPAVVGREELNMRVWDGRVVGSDAINRAVQMLRRAAAAAPAPAPFAIETVPRIGYRLIPAAFAAAEDRHAAMPSMAAGAPAPPAAAATLPVRRRRHRWAPVATMAAVPVALAAALLIRGAGSGDRHTASWRVTAAAALDDLPPGASDVTMSPDGRRLAYRSQDGSGRGRIFVRAAEGGGTGSAISPPALDARRPAWSPDGTALAFIAYDAGRPCRLFVLRHAGPAAPAGACETVGDPILSWSADGRVLLFGDAPGVNAVHHIVAVRLADGERSVVSTPPGDAMGDDLPVPRGRDIVFQRQFGWADIGWVVRDGTTGVERLLWHRQGVAAAVAAPLPGGGLAVAWTRAGTSSLDLIDATGRVRSQPVALGPVTALAAAGQRLLAEADRTGSALARSSGAQPAPAMLATVRGRIAGPALLPGGRLRFPVSSAGVARIWERDATGTVRPWGDFVAARISGVTPSPGGRLTAALVTRNAGREIVVFDAAGRPVYSWNPHARSVNPAAWSGDGRRLITPVLDGAGWRLFALDPSGAAPPRDLERPGFAVVLGNGAALFAVRAGETTGIRELWRLDGRVHRLPVDLTLFDIVNWRPVDGGIWLPDRSDRDRPRLVLRDAETGRVLRSLPAPGLAGPGSGLAADAGGPVYVRTAGDASEYSLLTLSRDAAAGGAP
ncbi:winged helix-turn-helix domain-containing protein [Sphingomonas sp.]|uniref:winged helix-turn-helix domain-containing protein n=1 Tax=Sphingomonas sp. TaxID=28214 RepID=UPI003CC51B34